MRGGPKTTQKFLRSAQRAAGFSSCGSRSGAARWVLLVGTIVALVSTWLWLMSPLEDGIVVTAPPTPRRHSINQQSVTPEEGTRDERRPDLASSSQDEDGSAAAGSWFFFENQPGHPHTLHNFTPQLPVGARKFCTAHPEDSTMEVMEPYVSSNDPLEIPNRTVWATGCAEPVMILPFQGTLMYPQLKCGALRPWKSFSVVGGAMHADLPKAVGVTEEPPPPVVKSCLDRCLDSPCCLTFGITRNASLHSSALASSKRGATQLFTCTLFYCDYTRAHHQRLPVESYPGYSYVLAHRREYRPSLVRSEWRIAMHRAPGRVVRLHGPDDKWSDVIRRGAPAPLPPMVVKGLSDVEREMQESALFDLRTVAEHGTLMQPVHGVATVRVRCHGDVVPVISHVDGRGGAPSWNISQRFQHHHLLDDELPSQATTVFYDLTSPAFQVEHGRAVSDGAWLPVRAIWDRCSGRWLQMDITATISRIVPDEALKTPFPDPPSSDVAVLRVTLVSIVHRLADAGARLGFTPPVPRPQSRFGELTIPPNVFSDSLEDCAPLLTNNECCVRFVHGYQVSSTSPSEVGLASHATLEHAYIRLNVTTEASDVRADVDCVTLVDGDTSHFDEDGIARFTNLVVRVNREHPVCVQPSAIVRIRGQQRFKNPSHSASNADNSNASPDWSNDKSGVSIPVSWFLGHCGISRRLERPATSTRSRLSSAALVETPILVSVPAHECLPCLHSFLANIRAFVWPSIVVIHFPSTISMPSVAELSALNHSHPRTFVNTMRVDSVVGVRLLHIHGVNIHYATQYLRKPFSHALLLASNELFVKVGVVEYIRRFDAVWMHNPTADTGALYEHHGDGRHRWTAQEFHEMEEMLRYKPRQWGFVWPDTIVADHWLAAAMRRRNLTKHPMNTILLEGTFFRSDIANEFADEMMQMFDPFDFCEEPMVYPHCEVLGPTVLQNVCERPGVRCGHRVTTMLWLREQWSSVVDDIRRVRCSPFEVPFGFKRIPRSMDNPVRSRIAQLTTAALVAAGGNEWQTVRDLNVTFCSREFGV